MTENTQNSQLLEIEGLMTLCDKATASYKKKISAQLEKVDDIKADVKESRKQFVTLKDIRAQIRQDGTISLENAPKLNAVKDFLAKTV